jgi:hypothetical protein
MRAQYARQVLIRFGLHIRNQPLSRALTGCDYHRITHLRVRR